MFCEVQLQLHVIAEAVVCEAELDCTLKDAAAVAVNPLPSFHCGKEDTVLTSLF